MREYISSPSTLTFSPYLASLLIAISVVFGGVVVVGGGGGRWFFSWKFAIFWTFVFAHSSSVTQLRNIDLEEKPEAVDKEQE